MALFLPNVIDVTVSLEATPSDTRSFSSPLFVVAHNITTTNIESYTSADSLVQAGFATNSPAHRFINDCLGGQHRPSLAKLGRMALSTITITVDTLVDVGASVQVNTNVNGVARTVSYTRQAGDADVAALATGLAAALTAQYGSSDDPDFAAAGAVITVTPQTFRCSFGWASVTNNVPHVTIGATSSDSVVPRVTALRAEDDDFAFLATEAHDDTSVLALAAYAEPLPITYMVTVENVDMQDSSDTDNLALDLVALNYRHTFLAYHPQADNYYPEGAWVGSVAGRSPETAYNPSNMVQTGIPSYSLTVQQRQTLTQRNVSHLVTEFGRTTLRGAWSSFGDFLDSIRFALWSDYTITKALFDLKFRLNQLGRTIPYSDEGAALMELEVRNEWAFPAIRGGRLFDFGSSSRDVTTGRVVNLSPVIDFGTRAAQTTADIGNRVWRNGVVEGVMISGINHVRLNVYIVTNR